MVTTVLEYLLPSAKPLRDYIVTQEADGQRITTWNLPQPQPTETELAAVQASTEFQAWWQARADALAREARRTATEQAERRTLEESAQVAINRLDAIIAGESSMTAAQVRAAVVDIARITKRMVKIIARTES
jgi:hypothetical protein